MSDVKTMMRPAGAVIHLMETTLHCQQGEETKGLVKDSASVPSGLHRSKELRDLSAFAPMSPELFGMVYLDDVDEEAGSIELSLRSEEGESLYKWSLPLSFYLVTDDKGELRWRKLDSRIEMMMDAVRQTLRRNTALQRKRGR